MATEKRLIDANAVIKKVDEYYHNSPFPHPGTTWLRGLELAAGLILNESTVDAVEVVRCKDCKHWSDGVSGCTDHVKCCAIGYYMVGENGYCVYGERREGK